MVVTAQSPEAEGYNPNPRTRGQRCPRTLRHCTLHAAFSPLLRSVSWGHTHSQRLLLCPAAAPVLPITGPELSVPSRAVTRCVPSAFPSLPAGNGSLRHGRCSDTAASDPRCLRLVHLLRSYRTGHSFLHSTLQTAQGLTAWHWWPPKPVPSPTSQLRPSLPPAGIPAPASHRPPPERPRAAGRRRPARVNTGVQGRSSLGGPPTKRIPSCPLCSLTPILRSPLKNLLLLFLPVCR